MKKRHMAIPAVYLLLEHENKILFMLRSNTGYCDNLYGLPSGHVEADESLLQAITRETSEEIGVIINEENIKLLQVLDRPYANDAPRLCFFFSTSSWEGTVINREPNKCAELKWVDKKDIAELPLMFELRHLFANNNLEDNYYFYDDHKAECR